MNTEVFFDDIFIGNAAENDNFNNEAFFWASFFFA